MTKKASDFAGRRLKSRDFINVHVKAVAKAMGKLIYGSGRGVLILCVFRSEGSLNQHLKLKHKEYFSQMNILKQQQ